MAQGQVSHAVLKHRDKGLKNNRGKKGGRPAIIPCERTWKPILHPPHRAPSRGPTLLIRSAGAPARSGARPSTPGWISRAWDAEWAQATQVGASLQLLPQIEHSDAEGSPQDAGVSVQVYEGSDMQWRV